jgi:hypothetical protein
MVEKKFTKAILTRASNVITIPEEIFKSMNPEGKNAVIILPIKFKKFTVFFTNAESALYIRLNLGKNKLIEEFFSDLSKALSNLNLVSLFTTGVCFEDEICIWEGIFEFDLSLDLNLIENAFSKIYSVEDCDIELLDFHEVA